MKKVLYVLAVVVAVLACKREDKAGSKDVVATALSVPLPTGTGMEGCCIARLFKAQKVDSRAKSVL